jgi:transcriptional regulator with XRE-family HTH domain
MEIEDVPTINPKTLKTYRNKRRFSLDRLAEKAHVNSQTIYRIESGKRRETRATTVERLGKALGVSPETLSDSIPQQESHESILDRHQSRLNVGISNQARNALTFVARQYSVTPADILGIAPFLFLYAAEQSLRSRKASLDEIEHKWSEMSSKFPHLNPTLLRDWRTKEIAAAEERSIKARDLFGQTVDDEKQLLQQEIEEDLDSDDYYEWADNPFATYLRSMASELGDLAQFDGWGSYGHPEYRICRDQVLKLMAGDEVAAEALLDGTVGLHELPKELRASDRLEERAQWVRDRADEERARIVKEFFAEPVGPPENPSQAQQSQENNK